MTLWKRITSHLAKRISLPNTPKRATTQATTMETSTLVRARTPTKTSMSTHQSHPLTNKTATPKILGTLANSPRSTTLTEMCLHTRAKPPSARIRPAPGLRMRTLDPRKSRSTTTTTVTLGTLQTITRMIERRGASNKWTDKIKSILSSTIHPSWSCADRVAVASLILTVSQSMRSFAKKCSKKKGKSSMPKSTAS